LHRVLLHLIGVMLRHGPSELVLLLPGQLDSREEATCQPCSLSSSFSLAPSPSFRSTQYLTSPSSSTLLLQVAWRAAATGLREDRVHQRSCCRRFSKVSVFRNTCRDSHVQMSVLEGICLYLHP
jgi:hypothetical protein